MTQVPNVSGSELFAAYVEARRPEDGHRFQWIILPRLPARLAPGNAAITDEMCWFQREQNNAAHRAVWRFARDTGHELEKTLRAKMALLETTAGWEISPIITVEVHPTELNQINNDRRTPYRILSRVARVAKSMHKLDVT